MISFSFWFCLHDLLPLYALCLEHQFASCQFVSLHCLLSNLYLRDPTLLSFYPPTFQQLYRFLISLPLANNPVTPLSKFCAYRCKYFGQGLSHCYVSYWPTITITKGSIALVAGTQGRGNLVSFKVSISIYEMVGIYQEIGGCSQGQRYGIRVKYRQITLEIAAVAIALKVGQEK